MFPFEVDYLASKDRYKDFQREGGLQAGGWDAGKLVEWLGSKLGNRSET